MGFKINILISEQHLIGLDSLTLDSSFENLHRIEVEGETALVRCGRFCMRISSIVNL